MVEMAMVVMMGMTIRIAGLLMTSKMQMTRTMSMVMIVATIVMMMVVVVAPQVLSLINHVHDCGGPYHHGC